MSQFIVGLTGGIGSGKTTVANEFKRLGVELVDADIIARDVVKPGTVCLNAIAEKFSPGILLPDGNLDRARLRTLIFNHADNKRWLNELMHPAIRTELLQQLARTKSPYCILIAPLLFENQLEQQVNRSLVVDVPEAVQRLRTAQRDNVTQSEVENIIKAQIKRTERLKKADDIINNVLPWAQVKQQILPLHRKYMAFLNKQP